MPYYYNTTGRGGFMSDTPPVTKNLVLINILVFIATMINEDLMVRSFALFYPTSQYFHIWQIITHMFMHGGWMHIFFNMYALYSFGSLLERMIGSRKFFIYYFACGLGAAALHTGVQALQASYFMSAMANNETVQAAMNGYMRLKMTPTVGASGAIYGLLIAYGLMFPDSRLTLIFPPISMRARSWVFIFVGIELLTGITGTADGIAHFAHLGGMLIGWLLYTYWKKKGTLYNRD